MRRVEVLEQENSEMKKQLLDIRTMVMYTTLANEIESPACLDSLIAVP